MTAAVDPAAHLISQIVSFPDGSAFTRLQPLTNLRHDEEEARVLYTCRKNSDSTEYVMKIKIQIPGPGGHNKPQSGPSATSAAEIEALERFTKADVKSVPHLVTWTCVTQGSEGLLPGGYITFTIMTKMPGSTIWDLHFWGLPEKDQNEIRALFLQKLQEIWALGMRPYDCALRNILWDGENRHCSVIDFEHWRPIEGGDIPKSDGEIKTELQRWGIVRRPPPSSWAQEWAFGR